MHVDWAKVEPVVRTAGRLSAAADTPVRSMLDQSEASMRDALRDVYGLDISDPEVVFLGFAWHGLIFSQLAVASHAGLIDGRTIEFISAVFRANAAMLAEYVPAEARQ